jgi:Zn-dependent protease with chaperone function
MPFLWMVFLTLVCLPDLGQWPQPLWGTAPPGVSVLVTWLGMAAAVGYAWLAGARVRRLLENSPGLREGILHRYERWRFYHLLGIFGLYILALCLAGWGWAVEQFWRHGELILPGAELVLLAPFLAALIFSWAGFYTADRACYLTGHRLLESDLRATGPGSDTLPETPPRPAPFGSRWAYVAFQVRQKLALIFIPVFLLLTQKELQRQLPQTWEQWEDTFSLFGFVPVLAVFVSMPWIIRLVLGLKPLPDGPLRQRLGATARRLRFRCSNILLWNTRSGMANAMVVGVMPWLRYVVFTDRLLEEFTADEVEAVFGHEVGHVKHHHMLLYLGFLTASMTVLWKAALVLEALTAAGVVETGAWVAFAAALGDHAKYLQYFPLVTLLLGYVFVVFGFLSRRCERQADVFGCRTVSCRVRDCGGHGPDAELPPAGKGLCRTGIRTFVRALEKVALVNGISRDRPGFLQSWQHGSIGRRVQFLESMLTEPAVEPRFQRRLRFVKWGLFLALGWVLAFLIGATG